jgi:hypothetical protein
MTPTEYQQYIIHRARRGRRGTTAIHQSFASPTPGGGANPAFIHRDGRKAAS